MVNLLDFIGDAGNYGIYTSIVLKPEAANSKQLLVSLVRHINEDWAGAVSMGTKMFERLVRSAQSGSLESPEQPLVFVILPKLAASFRSLFIDRKAIDTTNLESYIILLSPIKKAGLSETIGMLAFFSDTRDVITTTAKFALKNGKVNTLFVDSNPPTRDEVFLPLYLKAINLAFGSGD